MDELLMKYIKGETTPEEREKVVRWLDEDPEHTSVSFFTETL